VRTAKGAINRRDLEKVLGKKDITMRGQEGKKYCDDPGREKEIQGNARTSNPRREGVTPTIGYPADLGSVALPLEKTKKRLYKTSRVL